MDVLSAFYNSLAYTQPFRAETLPLYSSLVRLSAKGVDGGSRIPVANWADAGDEVSVQLLAQAGPPLHAVVNTTNRTNGEFLPIRFHDRDTKLVTINADVILYSETPIIQVASCVRHRLDCAELVYRAISSFTRVFLPL